MKEQFKKKEGKIDDYCTIQTKGDETTKMRDSCKFTKKNAESKIEEKYSILHKNIKAIIIMLSILKIV